MAKLTQPDAVVTAVDRSQSATRYKCWVCVVKYYHLVRRSIDYRCLFEDGRWRHNPTNTPKDEYDKYDRPGHD